VSLCFGGQKIDWWMLEYSVVLMGVLETPMMVVRGKPKAEFWKEGPTY
jgi:hypothetical protein